MIARQIECDFKPGKYNDFKDLYEKQVLPILRHQTGFLDSITLMPENHHERIVTITLWRTMTDIENYQKKEFPKIQELLKSYLVDTPRISYFTVEHTTFRKVETVAA